MANRKEPKSGKPIPTRRETAESVSADAPALGAFSPKVVGNETPVGQNRTVRDWWYEIQRRFHNYSCYGIFLLLPSDTETRFYLLNFGEELDMISRHNSVLIFLGNGNFEPPDINSKEWKAIVKKHILLGGSTDIARIFDIEYDKFPCLFLFGDIRSARHVVVSLKELTADEISKKLRTVFSVIEKATKDQKDPLKALENNRNNENLKKLGKSVVTEVRSLVGKTIEMAMQALVKASLG